MAGTTYPKRRGPESLLTMDKKIEMYHKYRLRLHTIEETKAMYGIGSNRTFYKHIDQAIEELKRREKAGKKAKK